MRKLIQALCGRDLVGDRTGIAAVEFALLLPVLLTLFIGSYETSGLLLAYLKLEAAAETAADLVAQMQINTIIDGGQASDPHMSDITTAVGLVMTPLSATNLKISIASITFGNATPKLDWHYETANGATAISLTNLPNGVTATTLGTASSTDSVIVAQVVYPYTSPLSGYFNTNYTLTEAAYNRPRYVNCVPYTTSCP